MIFFKFFDIKEDVFQNRCLKREKRILYALLNKTYEQYYCCCYHVKLPTIQQRDFFGFFFVFFVLVLFHIVLVVDFFFNFLKIKLPQLSTST